jgi:internalin A
MTRSELLMVIEKARQSGQISLDLSWEQITELPEEIGQLTNLTSLNLGDNQLTLLPESIVQLTNLTSLDLRSNQLKTLPLSLIELNRLKRLDIRDNNLGELPPEIRKNIHNPALYLTFYDNFRKRASIASTKPNS